MEKYDTYRGGMDDLSKPDQFIYQVMASLPVYQVQFNKQLKLNKIYC